MAPDEEADAEPAEKADGDGRGRLPQREVPAEGGDGNERGGRIDDGGGQPEGHDGGERRADRQQRRDEGDDLTGAEGGEAADKRGQEDHAHLASLEGARHEGRGSGRLEIRDEQHRRGDEGQRSRERRQRDLQDVRQPGGVERRHGERDRQHEPPGRRHAPDPHAQPVESVHDQFRHDGSSASAARAARACSDGQASTQHSSSRNAASASRRP